MGLEDEEELKSLTFLLRWFKLVVWSFSYNQGHFLVRFLCNSIFVTHGVENVYPLKGGKYRIGDEKEQVQV